jgi:hypothetical protein
MHTPSRIQTHDPSIKATESYTVDRAATVNGSYIYYIPHIVVTHGKKGSLQILNLTRAKGTDCPAVLYKRIYCE